MTDSVLAWHFIGRDRKLGYGDGRQVRKSRILRVDPPIELCHRGLHASVELLDALVHAHRDQVVACRVRVSGSLERDPIKLVGTSRECLWWVDAERVLHEFACWCASQALRRSHVDDPRCWAALDAKCRWLCGKATDAEMADARSGAAAADADAADALIAAAAVANAAAVHAAYAAADAALTVVYAARACAVNSAVAAARAARVTADDDTKVFRAQNKKLASMLETAARKEGRLR